MKTGAIGAMLVIAFGVLKTGTPYRELGGDYFDRRHPERVAKRLENFGRRRIARSGRINSRRGHMRKTHDWSLRRIRQPII
jgi:hypothetical protein